ncbi:unnamed protein product [Brassica oleracea]
MPVFSMNVFQLPASLCDEIDSILSGFWWGTKNGKRKMSYISWKKLAISKSNGGLGFRDLRLFNQALLANQLWKISRRPQCLIYRIFKHRYFPRSSIWNAKIGYQPSYGWKSLMYGRELLNQGMQTNIGNGLNTLLSDNWLPTNPPRAPVLLPYTNPTLTVNTLINPETNQRDNEIISDLIEQQDHYLIQQQFLSGLQPEDTKIWSHTKDGNYSVKSGYYSIIGTSENLPLASHPDIAKQIWKTETQPKLKLFLWRLFLAPWLSNLHFGGSISMLILHVFGVVILMKHQNIYFFTAHLLNLFGVSLVFLVQRFWIHPFPWKISSETFFVLPRIDNLILCCVQDRYGPYGDYGNVGMN